MVVGSDVTDWRVIGRLGGIIFFNMSCFVPNRSKNYHLEGGRDGLGGELIYRTPVGFCKVFGLGSSVFGVRT